MVNEERYKSSVYEFANQGRYVMTGLSALVLNGLVAHAFGPPCLLTDNKNLANIKIRHRVFYYYEEEVDFDNFTVPFDERATNIMFPTKERAIVDCIRFKMRNVDEGIFLEALYNYVIFECGEEQDDFGKLKEVSDFYNIDWKEIEYWMDEAEDFINRG